MIAPSSASVRLTTVRSLHLRIPRAPADPHIHPSGHDPRIVRTGSAAARPATSPLAPFVGKRQSRPWIVSDELWSLIEPLLPEPGPKLVEGRPRVPDRQALCGILFVLHTGIQWEYLPQELGFRVGDDVLAAPGRVERGRRVGRTAPGAAEETAGREEAGLVAGGDRLLPRPGSSARPKSGPSPVDRARPGSKHHVLTDRQGIPLAVSLTGGNRGRRHTVAASAGQG